MPPGLDVTVYSVMTLPPSEAGADHETSDCPFWFAEAAASRGAPGRVDGVTGSEESEAAPVPTMLVAMTVNVYAMPLVRPVTVQELLVALAVQVFPSGLEVTVYLVIGRPPVSTGAVQETTETPSAFDVPMTAVGASGGPSGVTAADGSEAAPPPATLEAQTLKVYETPLVSPLTVHDVVVVVQYFQPGLENTAYCVIAEPPLLRGAVQEITDF